MKKIILLLTLIGFIGIAATESYAQKTPRGKKRMSIQKTRIKRGVKSGSLTAKETAHLTKERRNIKKSVRSAKSDGKLSLSERRNLHKQLNRSSKDIYKAKHNNKTRRRN